MDTFTIEFLTATQYNLRILSPCSWDNYFQTNLIFFFISYYEYKGRKNSSCLKIILNLANIYIKMTSRVRMYQQCFQSLFNFKCGTNVKVM